MKWGRVSRVIAKCIAPHELQIPSVQYGSRLLHPGYRLKTPYRDGTTHVIFQPLDFIARLASLVPKPRVNLTRFHGVFAPNSQQRASVTPGKRGRGAKPKASEAGGRKSAGATSGRDDLGAAAQTPLRHRHRDLFGLRRGAADHRLHRGPRGDRKDSRPPRHQRSLHRTRPAAALSGATAGGSVRLTHRSPRHPHERR